jgi:hypothetical protein
LQDDVHDAREGAPARGGDDVGTILVRVHGDKAWNRKVVVAAIFDAGGGRGVIKVIWVVAVPIIVWIVLEPAYVLGLVAIFNAGGGRGVVEVIWVFAVPIIVRVVLEPADVIGVVAVFNARVGRGVIEGIWVVAVPVVIRVVLEPANVVGVLAISVVIPWHEG